MYIKLIIIICTRVLLKKLNCSFKKTLVLKNSKLNDESVMVIYLYIQRVSIWLNQGCMCFFFAVEIILITNTCKNVYTEPCISSFLETWCSSSNCCHRKVFQKTKVHAYLGQNRREKCSLCAGLFNSPGHHRRHSSHYLP